MVLASMYGSSASNEYGNGGTVNATGCSSSVKLRSGPAGPPAGKNVAPARSAPTRAAPVMLPAIRNSLRFIQELLSAVGPIGASTDEVQRGLYCRVVRSLNSQRAAKRCAGYARLDARERPKGRFGNDRVSGDG